MYRITVKYNKIPQPAKAGFWFTICNILQRGIQFLVVPIYTRILSAEGYGYYSVFIAWMNIFMVLATLNISGGIYYNGMLKYEKFKDSYTSSVLSLGTLSTILFFLFITILYPYIEQLIALPFHMVALMFLIIIVNQALLFWSAQQRLMYLYKSLMGVTVVNSALAPILGITFVIYFKMNWEGIVYGFAFSNIIICSLLFFKLFKRKFAFYNNEMWSYTLKLCLPLIPHYLSMIILGQMSRVLVQYYCGAYLAGIYSLAYQVSLIMNLLITGINSSLTPWMYRSLKKNEFNKIRKVSTTLTLAMVLLSTIAMLLSPEIVMILATKEYLQAIWIIPPVLVSTIITFVYCFYGTILFFYEQTKFVAISTSSGAVINIILNVILIPRYGFISASIATLLSYVVIYIMYKIFAIKACKSNNIIFSEMFDVSLLRNSIFGLLLIMGITLICFVFPLYYRYLLIVIFILLLYQKKKTIVKIATDLIDK